MKCWQTGEFIDAQKAKDWGLINDAVPGEQLDARIQQFTDNIRTKSPVPMRMGKALFYKQLGLSLPEAYDCAAEVMADNMMTADGEEGVAAFLDKRHPVWKGE